MSSPLPLFVTCAPNLEELLIEELKELGVESPRLSYRGVYVDVWDWSMIYTINYASRLASRVLLPLLHFRCFDKNTLYRFASRVEWDRFIGENATFAIDANVKHRELRNSLFAAQIVKDAICDQIREKRGNRPSVDVENPDVQINLFIQQQWATLSFDTSGAPLHKRGYRKESVEAPVQETLAAAMLRMAQYTADKIYLDTCCGSGTLLIEAALLASQTPPGYLRQKWGFFHHPDYQEQEWLRIKNAWDAKKIPLQPNHFFGVDRAQPAIRATTLNVKAAGFHPLIRLEQIDFREFNPPIPPDFILTNPPHGKRLGEEALLHSLYRSLGDFFKKKCAKPAKAFVFTGSLELAKEVGLSAKRRYVMNSGGMDARLLEFEIY